MSNPKNKQKRFSDMNSGKTNSFRRKRPSNINVPLKTNGRWAKLDSSKNQNSFKSNSRFKNNSVTPSENSRWGNLNKHEEKNNRFSDDKNSFKYRKPRYRGKKGNGLFRGAKIQDGVPQIKGCTQRGFNVMDAIQIKPKKTPKNKTPKNKTPKTKVVSSFVEEKKEEKTEEEKRQEELWKKSILEQYAYESFTDEEEDDDN